VASKVREQLSPSPEYHQFYNIRLYLLKISEGFRFVEKKKTHIPFITLSFPGVTLPQQAQPPTLQVVTFLYTATEPNLYCL
jgi:hypothetical protein